MMAVYAVVQAVLQGDTSLLVDASLGAMCLLLLATFGLVWRLNERMGKVQGAVFDEPFGLLHLMTQMTAQLADIDKRVRDLERAD